MTSEAWNLLTAEQQALFRKYNPQWSDIIAKYGKNGIQASADIDDEDILSLEEEPESLTEHQKRLAKIKQECILTRRIAETATEPDINAYAYCVVGEGHEANAAYSELQIWNINKGKYEDSPRGCRECERLSHKFMYQESEEVLADIIGLYLTHMEAAHPK